MANLSGSEWAFIGLPEKIKPLPFGGVARDFQWMTRPLWDEEMSGADAGIPARVLGATVMCGLFSIDFPCSLVGDIVTLPRTIPYLWMSDEDYHRQSMWSELSTSSKDNETQE